MAVQRSHKRQQNTPASPAASSADVRWRALAALPGVLLWSAAADGQVEAVPSWCAFTGQDAAALQDQGWLAAIHPGDQARVSAEWQRALVDARPITTEFRLRRADGRYRVIAFSAAPAVDDAGRLHAWVGTGNDLTPLREQEEAQRLEQRTHASLEALLAIAEMLVTPHTQPAVTSSPLTIAPLSQRVLGLTCQVMGCSNATFVSRKPDSDVAHLVASAGFTAEQERIVRQNVEGARFADRYKDKAFLARLHAGQVQMLDLAQPPYLEQRPLAKLRQALVVPIRLDESLLGVISLNHEDETHEYTAAELALAQGTGRLAGLILERERLLSEREEARARALTLRETTRQMDAFLSIVSHELRTPVTSIKTGVQLLLRQVGRLNIGALPPEDQPLLLRQQQGLERVEKQIQRLTRLLDDLIDLSRIRSGKLEIHLEACDLGALGAEVVEETRLTHPDRVVRLILPAGAPVQVMADPDRIGQVLTNYLTNALKYSPPDQPVEVGMEAQADQARVWVRDQGPGIPPAEQAQIWELFHRVPGIEVQSGSGVGLGLGLYISKTMIERHGGQVGVESQPGEGTTFWFTIPLAPDQ